MKQKPEHRYLAISLSCCFALFLTSFLSSCTTIVGLANSFQDEPDVGNFTGTLTADADTGFADGEDAIEISLDITSATGASLVEKNIIFSITGPEHFSSVFRLTDETGRATFALRAKKPGLYRVSAEILEARLTAEPVAVLFGDCLDEEDSYAVNIMGPVMVTCQGCHNRFGRGAELGTTVFSYAGDDDHIQKNIALMKDLRFPVTTDDGKELPYLLAKPLGHLDHGGGQIFTEDSPEAIALRSFLKVLDGEQQCSPAPFTVIDLENDVSHLSYEDAARKAAVDLTGHTPTLDETTLMSDTPESLKGVLDYILRQPQFFDRFEELLNDEFLMDGYSENLSAIYALPEQLFQDRTYFYACYLPDVDYNNCCTQNCCDDNNGNADGFCDAGRAQGLDSYARMSLDFYTYLIKNGRPATELLTADYGVFNRYTALGLGVEDANFFGNRTDEGVRWDLQPGHLQPTGRNSLSQSYQHAGLLTNPFFFDRYPNGDTNLNRHRARHIYKKFLSVDIMKFLNFSIDPNENLGDDPFQDARSCSACHAALDPVAGAFKNYAIQPFTYENRDWHEELRTPGFMGENIPDEQQYAALRWLGEKVVDDERFALSQVELFFALLTDHKRVEVPTDPSGASYRATVSAYLTQDRYLNAVRDRFVDGGYRLDELIKDIIAGPYYRAAFSTTEDADKLAALDALGIGGGMAVRPEQISRKLQDTLGMWWARTKDDEDQMTARFFFRYLYGGIDSVEVTSRSREATPVQTNINRRMAAQMACRFVPTELSYINATERRLFGRIERNTIPEDGSGNAIPQNELAIRETLVDLHLRLHNELFETTDPEIDATYKLFMNLWRDGNERLASGDTGNTMSYSCWVGGGDQNWDRLPQDAFSPFDEENPSKSRIEIRNDQNYTIRAWIGVMTYLLSDYRFFFH